MTAAGAEGVELAVFEERILAATRRAVDFDVIAGRDVRAILDVEAARQNAGCAGDSDCSAEIAGALDAAQLLSAQIGRVGNTWVLSLTRTERSTLTVQARVTREAQGASPEVLLGVVDEAVAQVFGVEAGGWSGLAIAGTAVGVASAVAVAGAGVATAVSWSIFLGAQGDQQRGLLTVAAKEQATRDGEAANATAIALAAVGGGLAVIDVALFVLDRSLE